MKSLTWNILRFTAYGEPRWLIALQTAIDRGNPSNFPSSVPLIAPSLAAAIWISV
ncbi:MAG: hypothetical protein K0S94_2261 [Nitrospira sp.]|nr:hypothetical protein [Nitrospira sp.]